MVCHPRFLNFCSDQSARKGTVLIFVAGLAALLLTMFLVLSRQVRSEVNDGILVTRDAQARLMLSSALAYILEAGRLHSTSNSSGFDQPGFGWTDVRDGTVGPKGPVNGGVIPSAPSNNPLPLNTARIFRMEAMICPPCAVRPIAAYNPVNIPPTWVEEYESATSVQDRKNSRIGQILFITYSGTSAMVDSVSGNALPLKSKYYINPLMTGAEGNPDAYLPNDNGLFLLYNSVYQNNIFCPDINTTAVLERMAPAHFNLQPQPVADTFSNFVQGNMSIRPESMRKSWFRIYRINPANDTTGTNGTVASGRECSSNGTDGDYGLFLITCGAGGTEGYKDWSEAGPTGRFPNQAYFEDLRRQERILWYRVRWSAFVGGGADMAANFGGADADNGSSVTGAAGGRIELRSTGGYYRQARQTVNRQSNNRLLQRRYSSHPDIDDQSVDPKEAKRYDGTGVYQTNPRVLLNVLGTIVQIERIEKQPEAW